MKNCLGVLLLAALTLACSSPRSLVLTETNREEVVKRVSESSMPEEEKRLFLAAMMRDAMSPMARALGVAAPPSLNGQSVGQIVEAQRAFAAKLETEAKDAATREAADLARKAEANRLISSKIRAKITSLRTEPGSLMPASFTILQIENLGDKDIAALVGDLEFKDLFGKKLYATEVRISDTIAAGKWLNHEARFYDSYSLHYIPLEKVKATWTSRAIAFTDGTTFGEAK